MTKNILLATTLLGANLLYAEQPKINTEHTQDAHVNIVHWGYEGERCSRKLGEPR